MLCASLCAASSIALTTFIIISSHCCREFGLVLKQMLYFDRYVRLLAPELEVFGDSRLQTGRGSGSGSGSTGGSSGSGPLTVDVSPA